MPTPTFFQNYVQVVAGTRLCLDRKLLMPALILIFVLMDTFAWATSTKKSHDRRTRFEEWVTRWVLNQRRLPCTSTELYAARCAVLHTLTADADLNKGGRVRRVCYAWGTAKQEDLQASLDALNQTDTVAVHVNDLLESVCEAMASVIERSETDAALRARLEEAAAQHFATMENETVAAFLERVHGTSNV